MASEDDIRDLVVGRSRVTVGRFTYGHRSLKINQWKEGAALKIGQFCSLGRGISIFLGGNHRTDWITTFPFGHVFPNELGAAKMPGHPATRGDVVIGDDVWIGAGAVILSGVTIGSGAVIGAQAVVSRDVRPYAVVGGNPGIERSRRFPDETIDRLLTLAWWDLPLEAIRTLIPTLSSPPDAQAMGSLLARFRPVPE